MSIISFKSLRAVVKDDPERAFINALQSGKIYGDANVFNRKVLDSIKRFQSAIKIPAANERGEINANINVLDSDEVEFIKSKKNEYPFIHIGAILISITALYTQSRPICGSVYYIDGRNLRVEDAAKIGFSFTLINQQSHFAYFPNYLMSSDDQNLDRASRIKINFEDVAIMPGSDAFVIDIGVMYRLTTSTIMDDFKQELVGKRYEAISGTTFMPDCFQNVSIEDLCSESNVQIVDDGQEYRQKKRGLFSPKASRTRIHKYRISNPEYKLARSASQRIDKNSGFVDFPRRSFALAEPWKSRENFFDCSRNHIKAGEFKINCESLFQNEHCGADQKQNQEGAWRLHMGTSLGSREYPKLNGSTSTRGSEWHSSTSSNTNDGGPKDDKISPSETLSKVPVWEYSSAWSKFSDRLPIDALGNWITEDRGASIRPGGSTTCNHISANLCSTCEGLGCNTCRRNF
ncbi:movement protein (MP) [Loquat virus A]|uniref:Movement protein (MP) n=1 Tax=Loquat virus A TaxID=2683823 RepID=A0A6B9CI30_9VIRU|nr:movement protein (MP) [Loquat virus A]QGW49049.1 movement protein (MP) [Loquat virus A]